MTRKRNRKPQSGSRKSPSGSPVDTAVKEPVRAAPKRQAPVARLTRPVSGQLICPHTPMGATLVSGGATFRVWAPNAIEVHIRVSDQPHEINAEGEDWQPSEASLLRRHDDGTWMGFVPGAADGDFYRFYIVGRTQPYKRDPYARELEFDGYPDCDCILRDPASYPWHDQSYRPPAFHDLIIYQLHVGTFYGVDEQGHDTRQDRVAKFLDVLDRLPHLLALGVNAIQPLPITEFQGEHSKGYNGTDLFSPEMDYAVRPAELRPYLAKVNALLAAKQCPPLEPRQLPGQINQLKALIDICHLYGLAVILDVVYNHAGSPFDDESIYFFDQNPTGDDNQSLYFTGQGHAGGLVFDYAKPQVRQFLINNAKFYVEEYHIDGFRYDEVTVIDKHGGWNFLQDLTGTLHFIQPRIPHIAEYWRSDPTWVLHGREVGGAGFDAVWHDGLRDALRATIAEAARGRDASVNLDRLRDRLYPPRGFGAAWRAVNYIENHDLLDSDHDGHNKQPRIAALADATDTRSWYARSRSRVATGLLLTAPGIPLLFMGQEFLEDKYWTDNPAAHPGQLIWWDGLETDQAMADHLRFTQDVVRLRRRHPALRGERLNVYYVHNDNRVIAFHRWLDSVGRDVVVVVSLNEATFTSYELGFPLPGRWLEVFNSDAYDHWINPQVAGNGGVIEAYSVPRDGLPHSAAIVIPANSLLIFARDEGDRL